jgi:hypothetical protein
MSKWKAEVQVVGEVGKWHGNGKVFDTEADAANYAEDLYARWTQTTCWRTVKVEETDDE